VQFTFDIDLQAIVDKTMAPENIAPVLEAAIAKAFKSAVDDATGYRSELQEKMKEQLKLALPHGLGIDDVAKFQHVLNAQVTQAVGNLNAEAVRAAMAKVVDKVLPDIPARVKLSELMEMARDGFHKEKHEAFFAELSHGHFGGDHWYLAFDSDENCRGEYSASFRLSVNKDGEVYSMKFDGVDLTPAKTPSVISKFESVLMCLYTGRTTLEKDMDEDDVKSEAEANHDD
jgi:hypothetical protein